MKKSIVLLLCFALLSGSLLTSCSDKNEEIIDESTYISEETVDSESDDSGDLTRGESLFIDFTYEVSVSDDIQDIATALSSESISGYNCETMQVQEGYLNGFGDTINGFNNGVMIAPVIGSIPFIMYIFESDTPEDLKQTLISNADLRWNICTEADEMYCEVYDEYVFFVMTPSE